MYAGLNEQLSMYAGNDSHAFTTWPLQAGRCSRARWCWRCGHPALMPQQRRWARRWLMRSGALPLLLLMNMLRLLLLLLLLLILLLCCCSFEAEMRANSN